MLRRMLVRDILPACLVACISLAIWSVAFQSDAVEMTSELQETVESLILRSLQDLGEASFGSLPENFLSSLPTSAKSFIVPPRGIELDAGGYSELWLACSFGTHPDAWLVVSDLLDATGEPSSIKIPPSIAGHDVFMSLCSGSAA